MFDPEDEKTHASYGLVQFVRTSNGGPRHLFGSAVDVHPTTICLTVKPAKWRHDLHHDWYFAVNETMIEVELSATQFTELITTMNMGSGVPCTIRRFDGERVEDPPDVETEVQRIKTSFSADLQGMVTIMKERRKEIEKLTGKLPEKAREQLRIELDVIIQQMSSNIPFIMKQFNAASDRVINAAKQEIEAFSTHAVQVAGLAALAGEDGKNAVRELMAGKKERSDK